MENSKGEHLHAVFKKRRELRHEFKESVGTSWREAKKDTSVHTSPEALDLAAVRDAIERGEIASMMLGIQDAATERSSHLKHTLHALDAEAAEFTPEDRGDLEAVARPDHAIEAQDRAFEANYEKVAAEMRRLRAVRDEMDRKEFALLRERRRDLSTVDLDLIGQYQSVRDAIASREKHLRIGIETMLPARTYDLRAYREELARDRYAQTLSRRRYEDDIRRLWEEGKTVLATGPTGTGKTEMLKHLAKRLYGKEPELLGCSDTTNLFNVFGRHPLDATPEGGTKSSFQPGAYTRAIDRDVPFIADEFNLLEPKVRLGFKAYYNLRTGDTVTIQEDPGTIRRMGNGFSFSATANLRNEKYKERFELDATESRVFEMRRIDYLPKEELYDLSLATLMDAKGRMRVSRADATQTLKRLIEAADQIQQSFLGIGNFYEEGGGGTKKKWMFEKAVLDPGKVLSMLGGWQAAQARGGAFDEYLNDQLRDFLNKEDFSEKDRALLLKIFLSKEFFAGRDAKEFHTNLTPAQLRTYGLKEKRTAIEARAKSLRPVEVAMLDPFGKRAADLAKLGAEFLSDGISKIPYTENGTEYKPGALFTDSNGKIFRYVGVNKEGKPMMEPYQGEGESSEHNEALETIRDRERAALRDFFGTDIDVPPVPAEITLERYERWKEMKLELYFLPDKEMRDDARYPGWKTKPGKKYTSGKQRGIEFLDEAAQSKNGLTPANLMLPGAWVLADTRDKPAYQNGEQEYQDDPDIGGAIKELRDRGVIQKYEKKPSSRFNISWDELNKQEVKEKLAAVLGVEPSQVRLPSAAEHNFLGNAHHEQWGTTNTWEWFADSYQGSKRLAGGNSDHGGLSHVSWDDPDDRPDYGGFRPLIVFPA